MKMGDTQQPGRNIYANRYNETTRAIDCGFFRLMLAWQGSVFKLIWVDMVFYIVLYIVLSVLYRTVFIHDEYLKELFELVCIYCSRFSKTIPLTFMTGFYVTNVVSRYWDQFLSLPWPDRLAYKLITYIPGQDDYNRLLRRTVMRYINLSTLLVFRLVSSKVHERFPCWSSLIDSGLVLPAEAEQLAKIDRMTPHETTWAPVMWVHDLLGKERAAGRLKLEPPVFANLIGSFEYIENCNRKIFNHGWVNFPLAYTQVVTITVYAYLCTSLFSTQHLEPTGKYRDSDMFNKMNVTISNQGPFTNHTPVVYFPLFSILEFIGYLGWIKVAETLLNPWGDDDEDFQINYLIDRNFQTSLLIVDEAISTLEMEPDRFMFSGTPSGLLPSESDTGHTHDKKFFKENGIKTVTNVFDFHPSPVLRGDKSNMSQLRRMSLVKPLENFGHLLQSTRKSFKVNQSQRKSKFEFESMI